MPILRQLNNEIVTEEKFRESFSTRSAPSSKVRGFEPIGPGLPLTIQIRYIYTGQYPVGRKKRDLLVTTAMKTIQTFNAKWHAVNFLSRGIGSNHGMSHAPATDNGTPIIYYTEALVDTDTVLTLKMGLSTIPKRFFETVDNILSNSAGIPLFAPAKSHLLTAGSIIKVVQSLSRILQNRDPFFEATNALEFTTGGADIPIAGYRLITNNNENFKSEFKDYQITNKGLVKAGKKYKGDLPYIIFSLDGRKNDGYKNFIPTAASSTLLDRFYRMKNGHMAASSDLVDALKIYSDYQFRKQADEKQEEIDALDKEKDAEKLAKKKKELDAIVTHIKDPALRPT